MELSTVAELFTVMSKHKLDLKQAQVLIDVAKRGEQGKNHLDLGRDLGLVQTTVFRKIIKLQDKGLVRSVPDPISVREHVVFITPAGSKIVNQILKL